MRLTRWKLAVAWLAASCGFVSVIVAGVGVAARIENPTKLVGTTSLSDRARGFARQLEIKVEENFPLEDYPRIKCNVARRTDERIYHLPFDQ